MLYTIVKKCSNFDDEDDVDIQEKINEYESQLRNTFTSLLQEAVVKGLEMISDEISSVAKVVHLAKEGVSKIVDKIIEIRKSI